MKVRFQADADLHQMIVTALVRREPSVDFQTATAAGLAGLLDPHVLPLQGVCWFHTISLRCHSTSLHSSKTSKAPGCLSSHSIYRMPWWLKNCC
jgi:hypothetical protein